MCTVNLVKTALLLTILSALWIGLGWVVADTAGMLIALAAAAILDALVYRQGDRLMLAMIGARPGNAGEAPEVVRLAADLAARAGLPAPQIYLIDDPAPTACAAGRNPAHAAIALSTGLLGELDRRELRGVLAHELAHIARRDTLLTGAAASLAGAIILPAILLRFGTLLGQRDGDRRGGLFGLLAVLLLAPPAALILQLALAHAPEYAADALGAHLCGDPLALARALRRLARAAWVRPPAVNPAVAPLCIVHPFWGIRLLQVFNTHPPVARRIARLEALAGTTPPDMLEAR
jgi:heat shock protein HtpX